MYEQDIAVKLVGYTDGTTKSVTPQGAAAQTPLVLFKECPAASTALYARQQAFCEASLARTVSTYQPTVFVAWGSFSSQARSSAHRNMLRVVCTLMQLWEPTVGRQVVRVRLRCA